MKAAERRLGVIITIVAAAAALWVWIGHASAYFFLFDDYALLAQATRTPLGDVVTTPLFGFYRPVVFLVTRLEGAAFGWTHPAGYAALNVVVHAVNAALVAALSWRLLGSRAAALASGVLFLCSPWSAEAVFWMSGRFDLWATAGSLGALTAAACTCAGDLDRRWSMARAVPLVAIGSAVALFSKESSLVLLALVALVLVASPGTVDWRRAIGVVATIAGVAVVYLVVRTRALSILGGVYGDWWTLVRGAPIGRNLASFARAVLMPPVAHDATMAAIGIARFTMPVAGVAMLALLVAATVRVRQVTALAAAFAVASVPVIWASLYPATSATGRVLYLPGIAIALWCGVGVMVLAEHRARAVRAGALAAYAVLALHALTSLRAQAAIWADGVTLARTSIEQFRPHVGRGGHVHVTNLPFWFEEGPYVLKSYAFQLYFYPQPVPVVSATALTLTVVDGQVRPVTRIPEPGALPPPDTEGRPITFDLGID